jgi:hypothetical protein
MREGDRRYRGQKQIFVEEMVDLRRRRQFHYIVKPRAVTVTGDHIHCSSTKSEVTATYLSTAKNDFRLQIVDCDAGEEPLVLSAKELHPRGAMETGSLPARSYVNSRYAGVRPHTRAIIAASLPGGAIETSTLDFDADIGGVSPLNVGGSLILWFWKSSGRRSKIEAKIRGFCPKTHGSDRSFLMFEMRGRHDWLK